MDFDQYVQRVITRKDVSTRDKIIFLVVAENEKCLNYFDESALGLIWTNHNLAQLTGISEEQAKRGLVSLVKKELLRKVFLDNGQRIITVMVIYNENILINLFDNE